MKQENLQFGVGLRAPHYDNFLKDRPKSVDWLEIISENYINAHRGYWEMLADLRHDYNFVMHGVALSIGATTPIDELYLKNLRKLADFLQVAWISDHLCFTGMQNHNTHDLLPIPYTQESLSHLIPRIHYVQEKMQRAFTFENASSYLQWNGSTISEPEFLTELHKATGCNILLDINNVYVSSYNHSWNERDYIDAIPTEAIIQYHLAGHTNHQTHLIDTHDDHVCDAVWQLYCYALKQKGFKATMIEWDGNIPEFQTLEAEINMAKTMSNNVTTQAA